MKAKLIIASLILTGFTKAQTLQDAIKKTENERYDAAELDFRDLVSKEPGKGEYYFYFGENYFNKDDFENARVQYQKGTEVNATQPLNYVGLGKVLWFQGKDAEAKTQFFKAASLGPKNAEVMRKTAEAYITAEKNKNLDEAIKLLTEAIKLDPKNPENNILLGDAFLEKNPSDGSPAIKEYQKATDLNPKSAKGILRQGKLYQRGRNYQLAVDLYKKATEIDPTFAPGYRELAEAYMLLGQNNKALEMWKKYLELNNSNYAHYRLFTALYKTNQCAEAIKEGEDLKSKGYSDLLYVERILSYTYDNCGGKDTTAYSKGLRSSNKFFELAPKDFKFIPDDYKHKGSLLSKMGKDSLGVVEMEKAITLDATANCDLNADIAKIWMKAKNYPKAIASFEKKSACPSGLKGQDNFDFGRAYYFSAGAKQREAAALKDAKAKAAKEAEALPLFVKADTCFSKLIQSNPTFAAGYFWKGRVETYLDPANEKWLSKPYFEKALTLIKPEEKTGTYKSNVIESLEYLGYYYVTTKDKTNSDLMFNDLKTIDPNNEKAKNYFNPPKGAAPKGK